MEHPVAAMLKAMAGHKEEAEEKLPAPKSLPIQARKLLDMRDCVLRANPFQVGDLVQQIKPFTAYRYPALGEIALVTKIGPPKPGSANDNHHREDMIVLCLCRSSSGRNDWVEFSVESWRFEKYEGEIERLW